jgi:hypothetical protein
MLKLTQVTALLVLAMLMSGCAPIPNVYRYAPAVSGSIIKDGIPVAGVQVHVSSPYVAKGKAAISGSDGRFATESIRKFHFIKGLLGDPSLRYSVKIMFDGETYEGYSEQRLGYAPKTLELKCDLSVGKRASILCTSKRRQVAGSRCGLTRSSQPASPLVKLKTSCGAGAPRSDEP